MGNINLLQLEKDARQDFIGNIHQCVSQFLYPQDPALICLPESLFPGAYELVAEAVREAGGQPIVWGEDLRWKSMLRQAFFPRVRTVIAPPMVVLGLSKISKVSSTPLFIRNFVPAGFPYGNWLIDGVQKNLDCRVFFCPEIVAERSCDLLDNSILEIAENLQMWNSILDVRIEKRLAGLEMEVIYFPGEKLPKLPACAKQILRKWDPETDEPLWWNPYQKNDDLLMENH